MSDNRLIALLVVATLIFGAVWLYFGVLGNEDPLEVTKTVEHNNVSIEVPDAWEVQMIEEPDQRLVVSSEDVIPYNPWQTIVSNLESPETLFQNLGYSMAFSVEGTTSYIVIQEVPQPEIQYLIDGVATSVEQRYSPENLPEDQEAEVKRETLAIGDNVLYNALEVTLKGTRIWEGNDTLFIGMYLAQIKHNEKNYLFTMAVVDQDDEQRGKSWRERSREYLDSVEITDEVTEQE